MRLYLLNRKKWEDSIKQKYDRVARTTEMYAAAGDYHETNERRSVTPPNRS